MLRIGLLSDTHGYVDPFLSKVFGECDEVWHAGDIGSLSVIESIQRISLFRGVFGNIDDQSVRALLPESVRFTCEGMDIFMTHIAGHPGRYSKPVSELLKTRPPQLLIGGHSHILRVMHDEKHKLLYVNPGAAGKSGLHPVRTVIRFCLEKGEASGLEVIELGKR